MLVVQKYEAKISNACNTNELQAIHREILDYCEANITKDPKSTLEMNALGLRLMTRIIRGIALSE